MLNKKNNKARKSRKKAQNKRNAAITYTINLRQVLSSSIDRSVVWSIGACILIKVEDMYYHQRDINKID